MESSVERREIFRRSIPSLSGLKVCYHAQTSKLPVRVDKAAAAGGAAGTLCRHEALGNEGRLADSRLSLPRHCQHTRGQGDYQGAQAQ